MLVLIPDHCLSIYFLSATPGKLKKDILIVREDWNAKVGRDAQAD